MPKMLLPSYHLRCVRVFCFWNWKDLTTCFSWYLRHLLGLHVLNPSKSKIWSEQLDDVPVKDTTSGRVVYKLEMIAPQQKTPPPHPAYTNLHTTLHTSIYTKQSRSSTYNLTYKHLHKTKQKQYIQTYIQAYLQAYLQAILTSIHTKQSRHIPTSIYTNQSRRALPTAPQKTKQQKNITLYNSKYCIR